MRYYTSDLHFGHKLVSRLRGFGSEPDDVRRHDRAIIENWNSVVEPGDLVYVLGDVSLPNKFDAIKGEVAELNGTKVLISGNHDACSGTDPDGWERVIDYMDVFDSVLSFGKVRLDAPDGHVPVLLSHYPYFGTDLDCMVDEHGRPVKPDEDLRRRSERYRYARLQDTGLWLLHGHTHVPTQRFHGGHQIHVGLDAWGLEPVPEDAVLEIILKEDARQHRSHATVKRKRGGTGD